uniref:PH domain-containing protein n=1 Tax=Hucho hucho TaxID=62062 RepID=A0A4W5QM88_9TELE
QSDGQSRAGYMLKKGHKRKNWTERWFLLKPNSMSYYVSEDLAEKKGDIVLDGNCCNSLNMSGHGLYKVSKAFHRDAGPC